MHRKEKSGRLYAEVLIVLTPGWWDYGLYFIFCLFQNFYTTRGYVHRNKQCFLKMDIETSYALLRELNVSEESLKKIYSNLIDPSNIA